MTDMVNHPPHYTAGSIECIDAIRASLGDEAFVAYCRGCVIKYSWRVGKKGSGEEDLKKVAWYANKASEVQKEIEKPRGIDDQIRKAVEKLDQVPPYLGGQAGAARLPNGTYITSE